MYMVPRRLTLQCGITEFMEMAAWTEFHSDPRKSYYLYLRQGYRCPAHAAYRQVKRVDTMVLELQNGPREAAAARLASLTRLLGVFTTLGISLKSLWENLQLTRSARSGT